MQSRGGRLPATGQLLSLLFGWALLAACAGGASRSVIAPGASRAPCVTSMPTPLRKLAPAQYVVLKTPQYPKGAPPYVFENPGVIAERNGLPPGATIAVDDTGEGVPVLLLHGFPATRHLWSRVAPLMRW